MFDGWNPTHRNGDEWGTVYDVYGIAIPTLPTFHVGTLEYIL